ncbi:MAG: threonine/serine exporter family protein [Treponema sp.]|nr:threonine/serine exporter family protein [Treponema sp.]
MSKFRNQHMKIFWDKLIDAHSDQPTTDASLSEKAALVGRLGLMTLGVGAGAYRVRAAMNKASRAMGIVCAADIGLLSIEYTCVSGNETCGNAISLSRTGVNTDKLNHLRAFVDEFERMADCISIQEAFKILDEIENSIPHYSAPLLGLAAAVACAAFTFLLGGGPVEMICAFFGAGVGNFVRKKLLDKRITLFANVALGVVAACLVYIGLVEAAEILFGISKVHQAGYICAMLFVIPGFPLITGGIDLAKLDLRSGSERILYALLIIFVATITGWLCAYAFKFLPGDFMVLELNPILEIFFRLLASFFAVVGFSLMFNSSFKMAIAAGVIGMIANVFRLELIDFANIPFAVAAFLAALLSGLLASATKKITGFPRLTITVPSIVIMVPGLFMYKGIYFLAMENVSEGALWLLKAALIVCSLSLGLIAARVFTDKNFRHNS